MKKTLFQLILCIVGSSLFSQSSTPAPLVFDEPTPFFYSYNIGAEFLDFCTDPSSGALGEAMVAASPFYPAAGLLQNPALLAMNEDIAGIKVGNTPWMRKLIPGMNILDLNAFYPIPGGGTLGYRFRYFSMNDIPLLPPGTPNSRVDGVEVFHQLSWARKLKENFSAGASFKYFRSDLGEYVNLTGYEVNPIASFAIDLGVNYEKKIIRSERTDLFFLMAGSIRNFGPKIKYSKDPAEEESFLPTTLALGILLNSSRKLNNEFLLDIDLTYQADKFLVPTPPSYYPETEVIELGKDPDISPFRALYQSFYDAPLGFREELKEFIHKGGLEIRLSRNPFNYFAIRAGHVIGSAEKSNMDYSTFGAGFGIKGFTVDFKLINARGDQAVETWMVMAGYCFSM